MKKTMVSVFVLLSFIPYPSFAANIILVNCYKHWQQPAIVHACVLDAEGVLALGEYQEADFETLNQQQHFSCTSDECRVLVGVGYCSADTYGAKSGDQVGIGPGWYRVELKGETLQLNKGRECI